MKKIFLGNSLNIFKFIIAVAIVYYGASFIMNSGEKPMAWFLAFAVCFAIVFFMFFKAKSLAKWPKIMLIFKIVRFFYIIFLVLYFCLVVWRLDYLDKKDSAIEKINNTKITIDDTMGKNLPPKPNQQLNDATIAGFDVNNNDIRDDVELAIFEKYPNSAKMRTAMLQYAQAMQLELTEVNSEETMIAYLQKYGAAYQCLFDLEPSGEKRQEINDLILNTQNRSDQYNNIYKKYMTSFSAIQYKCDIDLSSLPN